MLFSGFTPAYDQFRSLCFVLDKAYMSNILFLCLLCTVLMGVNHDKVFF